ncbi:uncharacterized protein LOC125828014 [Solanum verrucosum]|uniref:uncharacterized protein LOC125828014 n=1 Tax=Solanum verrucosum TaxID=315347 RepID=UPI0020D1983B|nr:uncharacterized protein LOC125828014 [Solanum verrucosum]
MAVTTYGGKHTIDPSMPSKIERVIENDEDEIEVTKDPIVDTEKEAKVTQKVVPMPRPPPLFPQWLVKKTEEGKYCRFIAMLRKLSVNVLLIDALEQMPGYAKFMKVLVTKKRAVSFKNDERLQHCSAIANGSLVQKKDDPGAFTIPCTIGMLHFAKALCDLGASINLMPFSIFKILGLGAPKPTAMRLLMADRTVKRPIGVLQDVLVKGDFLSTARALADMERWEMKFRLNIEEVTFNICRSMKHERDLQLVSVVNHIVGKKSEVSIEEMLGVNAQAAVIMNFDSDDIDEYDELVAALYRFEFRFKPK